MAGFLAVTIVRLLSLAFSLTNSSDAFARLIEQNPSPTGTPQMLQECKDLGIAVEQCTEQRILSARQITTCCPPGVADPNVVSEPKLEPVIIEILAGSGEALVASILE